MRVSSSDAAASFGIRRDASVQDLPTALFSALLARNQEPASLLNQFDPSGAKPATAMVMRY